MGEALATVAEGGLKGVSEGGVRRFLGVPYAASPLGERRFAAPQPYPAWEGVRDVSSPGPTAPQAKTPAFPGLDIVPLIGAGWREGDDFLQANIWAPEDAIAAPVMVFIHGGAFVGGSNDAQVTDGTAFARSGVVLVSINYRLGVEGWLALPGAPTNLGLRDQIAALRWVQKNIAAFGGDPANITVFGESAGAMSIGCLIASPLAKGLFRRAIVESGHGSMVRPIAVARRATAKLAKLAGVTPDVDGFATLSPAQWIPHQQTVQAPTTRIDLRDGQGREPAYGLSRFLPVFGDDVLPEHPLDALAKGAGAEVELLIGTNAEEMNLYFVPTGVKARIGRLLAWFILRGKVPKARAILKAYGMGRRKAGDAFTEALSDLVFRQPARAFAAAHRGRTHFYELGWRSPIFGGELGACHAIDLPFVFDTIACCTGEEGFVGPRPPADLAKRIHAIWVGFARDGGLAWPEYSADKPWVRRLEQDEATTEAPLPAAPYCS
ncbi:carboxylesterase/lipase family protein [Sphingomonas oryzagri]|uniref:Carboxylic ester hydrolase n=1 Tax=Sphingomonas oryzagri TaxID=3042314 RepID=A0ABT6N178_9SPHN|nr:carboxylesterase family protein [Sphingomonas oryzagri]MDH7638833.1 carboxylesterase family protein [Sphingomonas oryzagri]